MSRRIDSNSWCPPNGEWWVCDIGWQPAPGPCTEPIVKCAECSDQSLCLLQHIKTCTACQWLYPPCRWSFSPRLSHMGTGCVWVWAPMYRVWLNILTAYCLSPSLVTRAPVSGGSGSSLTPSHILLADAGLLNTDAELLDIDSDLWTEQGWVRRRFVEYRRWIVRYRLSFVKFLDENLWKRDATE